MHCITVRFEIRPGWEQAFRAAVVANARQSLHSEPGCRVFDVGVDATGHAFFLYELYDDEAAFAAHLQTTHFKAFDSEVAPWVLSKAVHAWSRLG